MVNRHQIAAILVYASAIALGFSGCAETEATPVIPVFEAPILGSEVLDPLQARSWDSLYIVDAGGDRLVALEPDSAITRTTEFVWPSSLDIVRVDILTADVGTAWFCARGLRSGALVTELSRMDQLQMRAAIQAETAVQPELLQRSSGWLQAFGVSAAGPVWAAPGTMAVSDAVWEVDPTIVWQSAESSSTTAPAIYGLQGTSVVLLNPLASPATTAVRFAEPLPAWASDGVTLYVGASTEVAVLTFRTDNVRNRVGAYADTNATDQTEVRPLSDGFAHAVRIVDVGGASHYLELGQGVEAVWFVKGGDLVLRLADGSLVRAWFDGAGWQLAGRHLQAPTAQNSTFTDEPPFSSPDALLQTSDTVPGNWFIPTQRITLAWEGDISAWIPENFAAGVSLQSVAAPYLAAGDRLEQAGAGFAVTDVQGQNIFLEAAWPGGPADAAYLTGRYSATGSRSGLLATFAAATPVTMPGLVLVVTEGEDPVSANDVFTFDYTTTLRALRSDWPLEVLAFDRAAGAMVTLDWQAAIATAWALDSAESVWNLQ